MKLVDKIAIHRLLSLITNFILAILKILVPTPSSDKDDANDDRWFPNLRKKLKRKKQ